jgi:hypothetical protein
MSLNVVKLYDKEYINKLGTEYISTEFMFDIEETKKDLPEQMASFDFVGVVADVQMPGGSIQKDQYSMSSATQGTGGSMGGQTGGASGGSY